MPRKQPHIPGWLPRSVAQILTFNQENTLFRLRGEFVASGRDVFRVSAENNGNVVLAIAWDGNQREYTIDKRGKYVSQPIDDSKKGE